MNNTNPPEAEIDWHSLSRARGWAMPSPRASAPWTEQEVEDVRAAQQRGESVEEIATAHGRSIGAIESQLNHMAMLAVSPNIKTLHEAGLTISCAQTLELLAQGIDDATVTTQLELRPKSILNFLQSAAKRWGVSGDDMRWEVINKARVLLQLPPLPAPAPEVTKPRLAPAVLEVVELWLYGPDRGLARNDDRDDFQTTGDGAQRARSGDIRRPPTQGCDGEAGRADKRPPPLVGCRPDL